MRAGLDWLYDVPLYRELSGLYLYKQSEATDSLGKVVCTALYEVDVGVEFPLVERDKGPGIVSGFARTEN